MKERELFNGRSIYFDKKGYPTIWVDGRNVKCHVFVWEHYNGPKLVGHDIHHINEDKSDYRLENLQLLTCQDHQRVHAGWTKTNGEWTHKPCTGCFKVLPLSDYYSRGKNYTPTPRCKPCHVIKTEEWKARNLDRVKEIKRNWYERNKQ